MSQFSMPAQIILLLMALGFIGGIACFACCGRMSSADSDDFEEDETLPKVRKR